jgi:L-alanine-DL-glutamate epimerase-like enolase superfamily enzyme
MKCDMPNFFYGEKLNTSCLGQLTRGLLTEKGLSHIIDCVIAMKDVLGIEVGLVLDCGPGFTVPDAIKLGSAMEPYNIMWLEDLLTGDFVPWIHAEVYREVTRATTVPLHTGEQIYLRHNFKELLEKKAIRILGPDPCDVGGIAELKWIAEYADLHGVLMAPHGTGNGLVGPAALVQVCATLPSNYIAFEYPIGDPSCWHKIVEGLPTPIVVDSHITVSDRPGMGVDFLVEKAQRYLQEEDRHFFDA